MTSIAFVNGSYFDDTGHYAYAAELFIDNQKQLVRGSGNESEWSEMWSIGAKIKGVLEVLKKASELKVSKIIIINNLDFLTDLTKGTYKPKKKGNVVFVQYLRSIKDKIDIVIRRPSSEAEKNKLEELRLLARQTLGL